MPRYYRTVHATQTVTNKATTNKQSKRRTTKNSTFKEGKQKICASGGVELGDMVQQKPITSEYSSTTKSAELFDLLLSENGVSGNSDPTNSDPYEFGPGPNSSYHFGPICYQFGPRSYIFKCRICLYTFFGNFSRN